MKEHDYFLELIANPTFNPQLFLYTGLNPDNTDLSDYSTYKNATILREHPMFLDEKGNFDESKLKRTYNIAVKSYNNFVKIAEDDSFKIFSRYDTYAPEAFRRSGPDSKIERVANPNRQLKGFTHFGITEEPDMTEREIAQTMPVYNPNTKKYEDSPNESWIDNYLDPKVLAQWEFDADENGNMTNDPSKIYYHKGDKKIHPILGTYYYENLGDRDIYGREVLSGNDTITTDGSWLNKIDFLDSDDKDKSFLGSLMKSAVQIVPAFIPGVRNIYIGTRIGLNMAQLFPAALKAFSLGNINSNNILGLNLEGINKATSLSSSDYANEHPWAIENVLKLGSDIFLQLAEQRYIFKWATSKIAKINPKMLESTKEADILRQKYITDHMKPINLANVPKAPKSIPEAYSQRMLNDFTSFQRSKMALDNQIKNAQELSKKISMAYMTGITTVDSYGEAKLQGASDTEAALFALGYSAAEYGLLNTDIGKWILPELKLESFKMHQIGKGIAGITKASKDNPEKLWKRLFLYGKELATQNYSDSTLMNSIKLTTSGMLSEAVEETSEELLVDLAKTAFNMIGSLRGDDTRLEAFDNIATRYGMSFFGGAIGGGIATGLPGYRAVREELKNLLKNPMTPKRAMDEIVHIVADGRAEEFKKVIAKSDFGYKNLTFEEDHRDENGSPVYKPAASYEQSLDFAIKQRIFELVDMVDGILNSEGAKISTENLISDKLIRKELKYRGLLNSLTLSDYVTEFRDLSSDIVDLRMKISELESSDKTDTQKLKERKEEAESKKEEKTTSIEPPKEELIEKLKEEYKEKRKRLQEFINGSVAREFVGQASFEIDPYISAPYVTTQLSDWIKEKTGKNRSQLSKSELDQLDAEWEESEIERRDAVRKAYQIFLKNLNALLDIIKKYDEDYFRQNKDNIFQKIEEELISKDEARLVDVHDTPLPEQELIRRVTEWLPDITRQKIWAAILDGFAKDPKVQPLAKKLIELYILSYQTVEDSTEKITGKRLDPTKLPASFSDFIDKNEDGSWKFEDHDAWVKYFLETEEITPDNDDVYDYLRGRIIEFPKIQRNIRENDSQDPNTFNPDDDEPESLSYWEYFLTRPEVLSFIKDKLKNLKYLTPTTKQYLKNFFSNESALEGNHELVEILRILDKDIAASPVEELLSNMIEKLKDEGFDVTNMITDVAALLDTLGKTSSVSMFLLDNDILDKINKTLILINLAHSHIEAAKTEIDANLGNFIGHNAMMNELVEKFPIEGEKTPKKLVTINAYVADSISHDLAKIYTDLNFYRQILAANSNTMLTDHVKVETRINSIYYNNLKRWVVTIPDDWEGKDKIVEALNQATLTQTISPENDVFTKEERKKLAKEKINYEQAVYDFFNNENNKNKSPEELAKLFSGLDLATTKTNTLNSQVKYEDDSDFVWYLASLSACSPKAVLKEYTQIINNLQYAPVVGLEEAVRRMYSYILNPQMFSKFIQAYNQSYKLKEKYVGKDNPYHIISLRHFLLEGIAGSGKTSGTYETFALMLETFHPELTANVWIISNSLENAKKTASKLGFKNVTYMAKSDDEIIDDQGNVIEKSDGYFTRIANGYKYDKKEYFNDNGTYNLPESELEADEEGFFHFKNAKVKDVSKPPTLILFDEISTFSQQDILLSEDFLEKYDIYSIAAGDFEQLGLYQPDTKFSEYIFSSTVENSNFAGVWKLGQSMRVNNDFKASNNNKIRAILPTYAQSKQVNTNTIHLSYYEDDDNLYGDKVVESDVSEITKLLDKIKKYNQKIGKHEKLHFIYSDPDSEAYKHVSKLAETEEYKNLIKILTTGVSQGQEGMYYVIDLGSSYREIVTENTAGEANLFIKSIYTAMTRAKQGTIIFGVYGTGESKQFASELSPQLQVNNLSDSVINKFKLDTIDIKNYAIEDIDDSTDSAKRNRPEINPVEEPEELEEQESDNNDEEITEDSVERLNIDKPVTIQGELNKLNMLLHTVMCYETGCEIENGVDPTLKSAVLIPGHYTENRIDNIHGLIHLKKRIGKGLRFKGTEINFDPNNPKIEGDVKDYLLTILGRIRGVAQYATDNAEIEDLISSYLGVKVKVSWGYKNLYSIYRDNESNIDDGKIKYYKEEKNKPFSKFFKGVKEYLAGIFNPTQDAKKDITVRQPKDQTIDIIVSVDEGEHKGTLILDIPVAKFTSPLTLLDAKEADGNYTYKDLRNLYIKSGEDISKFKKEVKRALLNKSNIPYLFEFALLLDTYSGSAYNTFVPFDEGFTLAGLGQLTGITISHDKGGEYSHNDSYYFDGEWIPIEEYKKRMPYRKITKVFAESSNNIDGSGVVDIHGTKLQKGNPFILVSDYYNENTSDEDMLKNYIKLLENPNATRKIKLVYVVPPSSTIEEYIYNLTRALGKTKDDSNFEEVDKSLGNKNTSFHLILFALENPEFMKVYQEYLDSNPGITEKHTAYLNKTKELIDLLKSYNDNPRKLYSILNTPISSLLASDKSWYKTLLIEIPGEPKIKYILPTNSSTLTLRHFFLLLLRRMLLSSKSDLSGTSKTIIKECKNGKILTDSDTVRKKIDAFVKASKWDGVLHHLMLKPKSSISIKVNDKQLIFAEIQTDVNSEYRASKKPLRINGKIDSTQILIDAVPLLKRIIYLGRDSFDNFKIDSDLKSARIFARLTSKENKSRSLSYASKYANFNNEEKSTAEKNSSKFELLMREYFKGDLKDESKYLTDLFDELTEDEQNELLDKKNGIINRINFVLENSNYIFYKQKNKNKFIEYNNIVGTIDLKFLAVKGEDPKTTLIKARSLKDDKKILYYVNENGELVTIENTDAYDDMFKGYSVNGFGKDYIENTPVSSASNSQSEEDKLQELIDDLNEFRADLGILKKPKSKENFVKTIDIDPKKELSDTEKADKETKYVTTFILGKNFPLDTLTDDKIDKFNNLLERVKSVLFNKNIDNNNNNCNATLPF